VNVFIPVFLAATGVDGFSFCLDWYLPDDPLHVG